MHRKVADLYEYLYIYCGEARGNVLYGTVTPETLTEFQMTEEEAFVLSHKNMIKNTLLSTADGALYGYGNMMEISKENMINFVCSSDMPIIVVKGKNGRCGAAYALLQKVNQKILELYPNGYYLIPSSTKEMIIVARNSMPLEEMKEMVSNINGMPDKVKPEEILSNSIYEFIDGMLQIVK